MAWGVVTFPCVVTACSILIPNHASRLYRELRTTIAQVLVNVQQVSRMVWVVVSHQLVVMASSIQQRKNVKSQVMGVTLHVAVSIDYPMDRADASLLLVVTASTSPKRVKSAMGQVYWAAPRLVNVRSQLQMAQEVAQARDVVMAYSSCHLVKNVKMEITVTEMGAQRHAYVKHRQYLMAQEYASWMCHRALL